MAGHGFRRRAVSDGEVRLCPLVAPTTDLAQAGSEGWLQMASGSSARYEYIALRDCWTPPGTGLSVGQAIARGPWHAAVVARRLRRDSRHSTTACRGARNRPILRSRRFSLSDR